MCLHLIKQLLSIFISETQILKSVYLARNILTFIVIRAMMKYQKNFNFLLFFPFSVCVNSSFNIMLSNYLHIYYHFLIVFIQIGSLSRVAISGRGKLYKDESESDSNAVRKWNWNAINSVLPLNMYNVTAIMVILCLVRLGKTARKVTQLRNNPLCW